MKPTLVLLPGMDGSGELFAPLLAALGRDMSVIVVRYPDVPGDYAAHEAVARAALPTDRPYVVLGESFSGPIALAIAAAPPQGLCGYILCCSFVTTPVSALRWVWPLFGVVPALLRDRPSRTLLMGRFATPDLRRGYAQALQSASARTLVARLRNVARVDVRHLLARISVPGLYLRATEDRLVPRTCAARFARLTANARVADVVGPHFLLQSNPTAAAAVIEAFARALT